MVMATATPLPGPRRGGDPALAMAVCSARFDTAKRGIAVEIAERLARGTGAVVCLIDADDVDRDVARRLPELRQRWGTITAGSVPHAGGLVEVQLFDRVGVCVVSVPRWTVLADVLHSTRTVCRHVVVDAPPRLGIAMGRSIAWLEALDLVFVAAANSPPDVAVTKRFCEQLAVMPVARHLDVRVALTGSDPIERRAEDQVTRRLADLNLAARLPALWGRAARDRLSVRDELALDQLVTLVLDRA
jgi:hypothetical protein